MSILNGIHARTLTLVLLVQAIAYIAVARRTEIEPNPPPLSQLPIVFGPWTRVADFPMEKEIQDVLRADDTLTRTYVNPADSAAATLFLAFFKTQRTGQAPHSPKNCLPGSGWEPTETGFLDVGVSGKALRSIRVNRYVVSRGGEQSVVLYWYQSHGRVIAGELMAKLWLVADAIRYRRSDTALVRVTVPVHGQGTRTALQTATSFVQAAYPEIEKQLPF